MAGWHHQCNGLELGQTLGDGEGQGNLLCCSSWGHKELDTSGQLNHNKWKNHSFDCMDLCWQSDISAFQYAV